jgi:HSP90 family molecular chaperone
MKITRLVKQYSDYIRYPIKMLVTHSRKKEGTPDDKPEYEQVQELETLNSMVPLWKKPKAEVTEDALKDFEEGIKLSRGMEAELDKIEGKIQILMNEPVPQTKDNSPQLDLFSEPTEVTGTRQ